MYIALDIARFLITIKNITPLLHNNKTDHFVLKDRQPTKTDKYL